MKTNDSILKLVILGCLLIAAAAWIGFGRGYKAGRLEERQAWESTATSPLAGRVVSLENSTDNLRTIYLNPHSGIRMGNSSRFKPQNRPDLRNMPGKPASTNQSR